LVRRISIFILFCWGVFLSVFFAGILSSSFKGLTGRNKPAVSVSATGRSSHSDQSTALVASQADLLLPSRPLYPFSIIPGGVENAQELKNALAHDAVAESHYAGFNVAKAHVIRMDRDRAMYVSYRMGDRVFWTSKMLRIPKGESVITDGEHMARTRCGNLLSATPILPISPRGPSLEAMEALPPPEIFAELQPLSFPPVDIPPPPPIPATPATPPAPPSGPPGFPIIPPPYFPITGGGGFPSHPVVPPVGTPEPGEFSLLAIGVCAVLTAGWFAAIRKKRKA
jgi:hypothetical protein